MRQTSTLTVLVALTIGCTEPAAAELEGCMGPLDCKLDRVCIANMCMAPADAEDETSSGAATVGEDATSSTGPSEESSSSSSAPEHVCGWGPTGQEEISEGYVCGGEGSDPSGAIERECPAAIALVPGGACGEVSGVGCCDPSGDVWYCADDGTGPVLYTETCTS